MFARYIEKFLHLKDNGNILSLFLSLYLYQKLLLCNVMVLCAIDCEMSMFLCALLIVLG